MNEVIKKMMTHKDCEIVYFGEFVSQHLDDSLSRLEALGYSHAQAEAGVSAFAQYLIGEANKGRDLPACDYVEDMVELMAGFCPEACKIAA